MKHLVYESDGQMSVATGTVEELEGLYGQHPEAGWYNALGISAERATQNYQNSRWYQGMVETYGADEDDWPEE